MLEKLKINETKKTFIWEWKEIEITTWKLAPQSWWSVTIRLWDTELLCTAVINPDPNKNNDFLPLTIEFKETYYASWKIWWWPYNKREWRPSEYAILNARLTDRPIRPMFPEWMVNDVVVTITCLSVDRENIPWILSIIWSSLAIMLAWIPFEWPVWAVRIWYQNWEYVINPTTENIKDWKMNLVVAWSEDTITMVECWSDEISTEILMWWFKKAQEEIKKICQFQKEFLSLFDIEEKKICVNKPWKELLEFIKSNCDKQKLESIFPSTKKEFNEKFDYIEKDIFEKLQSKIEDENDEDYTESKVKIWVFKVIKEYIRSIILSEWKRVDWRWLNEVRKLYCETWLFKRVHWSWLFQRWETQVLSLTTLWAPWDVEIIDTMEYDEVERRFIHHYNMPPFANNEARPTRFVNRREVWHWRLAEKSIMPVIPEKLDFPYTIRSVSEVLSSNWSTSMASVCATTLSLMDAWIPLKAPVSWIAMWLVTDENLNYKILTDIQWLEDFTWDMDFKVAWTKNWINALQMDMKIKWLKIEIIEEAIEMANKWRLDILDFMLNTLPWPREEISVFAPKIHKFKINVSQIKEVIWPWWSVINEIIKETNVKIDFEEDWTCIITSKNDVSLKRTLELIEAIIRTPKVWEQKEWVITRVENYWIFVNIWNSKIWLCHVKNLGEWYIADPKTLYKEWDKINVIVLWIETDWKIQLKKCL